MMHRCLIHTMSDAHAWLRPFFANLWNGAPAGRKQLAAFRTKNYAILRNAAIGGLNGFTFSPYNEKAMPLGFFQVTDGKLPFDGNLFQTILDTDSTCYLRMASEVAAGSTWYNYLASAGLKIGDTLALFIFIYDPNSKNLQLDSFTLNILEHDDFIIGTSSYDNVIAVTPVKASGQWSWDKDWSGVLHFEINKAVHDVSCSVLMSACFQIEKKGSALLCSKGYLWHWDLNVDGLTFMEALKTYPVKEFVLNEPPQPEEYKGVDLGLPSGLLWHEYNLGADVPEGAGDYYSWGNVDGHAEGDGYSFDQNSYDVTTGATINSNIEPTSGHDPARLALGGNWRMPTSQDFEELLAYTNWEEATINNVLGLKFTNRQNSSAWIFIPCAGYITSQSIRGFGERIRSWTSTFGDVSRAYMLSYYDTEEDVMVISRRFGLTIRPVTSL